MLFVGLTLLILQNSVYNQIAKNKFIQYSLMFMITGVILALMIASERLFPAFLAISVSNHLMIASILLFLTAIVIYSIKNWTTQRDLLLATLPFIIVSSISGILIRLTPFTTFFSSQVGKTALLIVTIMTAIWFFIILFITTAKHSE